jgi:hypothetical protein
MLTPSHSTQMRPRPPCPAHPAPTPPLPPPQEIQEPNAIAVASAAPSGAVSVRMVLLKQYDARGFCFFTNYNSRWGRARRLATPKAGQGL